MKMTMHKLLPLLNCITRVPPWHIPSQAPCPTLPSCRVPSYHLATNWAVMHKLWYSWGFVSWDHILAWVWPEEHCSKMKRLDTDTQVNNHEYPTCSGSTNRLHHVDNCKPQVGTPNSYPLLSYQNIQFVWIIFGSGLGGSKYFPQ